MDLDGDGRTDILSGSWPGEIYFFRRLPDGGFAVPERLKTAAGKPLNVGSASAPFAFDWDGDGKFDLLVGTVSGEVFFVPNVGTRERPAFGGPKPLAAGGKPIRVTEGDAAPVVADWDADGKPDLVVGAGDGSVVWFRNEGTAREPRLAAARVLVPPCPSPWVDDKARGPADWGVRVKPWVVDWDGDGRPDLLLGDRCGGCERPPARTPEEAAEAREAADHLPALRKEWAATYRAYVAAADPVTEADRARVADLRARVKRLKDEIARLSDVRDRYKSGYMIHGYVWLFRRLPAGK
ncbi:MAG: VCBS repeat-containing protein [Gemmataceae bacterium]